MVEAARRPPRQGELVKLDFDPTRGHEQRGYRPALVVSIKAFNRRTGLCWLVPVTSVQKGLPGHLSLPAGLEIKGYSLLPQMRSMDWRARHFRTAGVVPAQFLDEVNARLCAVLDTETTIVP